jgi:hypothetical protein
MAKRKTGDFHAVERTVPCSNCTLPVKVRRRSLTGLHFCAARDCQAAKQRAHYARRRAEADRRQEMDTEIAVDLAMRVLTAVINGDRVECESCGRTDAIVNLIHPTPDLTGACRELVRTAPPEGMGPRLVYALWPETQS